MAGAGIFLIWALLHFKAAWSEYKLGLSLPEGIVRGRVLQDEWNLLAFSIIAFVTAASLHWRNDFRGSWINFMVAGVTDVGFVLFVLLPGHILLWPILAGPLFWILGLILSSLALRSRTSVT